MAATDRQIKLLRHSLGLDRQAFPYRNHYAAGPGTEPDQIWSDMVVLGLATKRDSAKASKLNFYNTTEAGMRAAGYSRANPHVPVSSLTRSAHRDT